MMRKEEKARFLKFLEDREVKVRGSKLLPGPFSSHRLTSRPLTG